MHRWNTCTCGQTWAERTPKAVGPQTSSQHSAKPLVRNAAYNALRRAPVWTLRQRQGRDSQAGKGSGAPLNEAFWGIERHIEVTLALYWGTLLRSTTLGPR